MITLVVSAAALTCGARADTTYVTVPPYWTGTYNRASGTTLGGPYLAAQLTVNGVLVRNYVFEDELEQHLTLSAVIDSTHFINAQSVSVAFWALRSDLVEVSASDTVPVKNAGFAWELPEFASKAAQHSSDDVQSIAGQAGWEMGESHSSGWRASDVNQELSGSGVHYVNSHGGVGFHIADYSWQEWDGTQYITVHESVYAYNSGFPDNSYAHMRMTQIGDYDANPALPAPPYNPSGVPQITFAFVDSCLSGYGVNNIFSWLLYPGRIYDFIPPPPGDPSSPYTLDQAVLTWNGYSSANKADRMNKELWGRLLQKKTIGLARQEMIAAQASLPIGSAWFIISPTYPNTLWRRVTSDSDVPVFGDVFTRIHGVYTGSDVTSNNDWYL